jgi:hypothetical protein
MAQHDYVLANATGAGFRSDINNALAAIVGLNSGVTEPASMFAYMLWADTTTGLLKQRNGANDDWITIGPLANLISMAQLLTAAGSIIYASAANVPAMLAKGAAYKSLNMNSAGTFPEWQPSPQSLMGAQSILAAVAANTPVAITVAAQCLVGRKTGGNVTALTQEEAGGLIFAIGTKMYFYQNTAPAGWTYDAAVVDRCLAVKGGTQAYNVNGGNQAGTWTQPDHTITVAEMPIHHHHYNAPGIGYVVEGGGSYNCGNFAGSDTDSAGSGTAHNHGTTYRPHAAVGIIATKD